MEPPELYVLPKPGFTREEVEKLNADFDQDEEVIKQRIQDVGDLRQLPEEIKNAVEANRLLSRKLRR